MSTTTRHPYTGELLEDESQWRDAEGNWYPVEYDPKEKKYKPVVKNEGKSVAKTKENEKS